MDNYLDIICEKWLIKTRKKALISEEWSQKDQNMFEEGVSEIKPITRDNLSHKMDQLSKIVLTKTKK